MLGSLNDCKEVKSVFNTSVNTRPDALILCYPVVSSGEKAHRDSFKALCGDDEELKGRLDAAKLIRSGSPAAFIWATRDDGCVSVKNSLMLAEAYEREDLPFSLHIWGKGQHGLSVADMTVYKTDKVLRESSAGVCNWLPMAIDWLKEQGIYVK